LISVKLKIKRQIQPYKLRRLTKENKFNIRSCRARDTEREVKYCWRFLMKHAIVIGSSMAGLLAARALSERFTHVTVLERDRLPENAQARKGVPQGQHGHGLLAAGLNSLEALFPGFTGDLIEAGAQSGDAAANVRWFQFGAYKIRSHSGITGLFMSRPLIESRVYAAVKNLPNVSFVETCSVVGLTSSQDKSRVTGVQVSLDDYTIFENLEADLVVDASGRGSQAPNWLEALGYAKPAQSVIKIDVGYTTRTYRRKPNDLEGDLAAILVPKAPTQKQAGVLLAMEGKRWMLTIAGTLGDHAPSDEAGFLEAVKNLPAPDIYNVVKNAEPLSSIVSYKYPNNQRRHFERLERFPQGFLVFGDALCSFNPIYGQGMTVASLEALALLDETRVGLDGLSKRFFARAAKVIETPWTIAIGEDLRYPEVEASRSLMVNLINWYIGKVHVASQTDSVVCNAFHKVSNLLKPPPSLFAPQIVARMIRANLIQPKPQTSNLRPTRVSS
jgi:2-polyprenyl-6-methoxyphenol hydroxylase-like FAD-dependent oxidoreductase